MFLHSTQCPPSKTVKDVKEAVEGMRAKLKRSTEELKLYHMKICKMIKNEEKRRRNMRESLISSDKRTKKPQLKEGIIYTHTHLCREKERFPFGDVKVISLFFYSILFFFLQQKSKYQKKQ